VISRGMNAFEQDSMMRLSIFPQITNLAFNPYYHKMPNGIISMALIPEGNMVFSSFVKSCNTYKISENTYLVY